MKFDLKDSYLQELEEIFRSIPNIEEVLIYGSRARGDNSPVSDVDIVVCGPNVGEKDMAILGDKLYESNIPYFFDVCRRETLRSEKFIENVERDAQILYKKPPQP